MLSPLEEKRQRLATLKMLCTLSVNIARWERAAADNEELHLFESRAETAAFDLLWELLDRRPTTREVGRM